MRKIALSLFFLSVLASPSIFAAEEQVEADPTQVLETEAPSGSFAEKLYTDFQTEYHGSSVEEIGSNRVMDHEGNLSNPSSVNFDSELGAGYRWSDSVKVGLVAPFVVRPGPAQNFILGDAGFKIAQSNAVNWNGLRVAATLILQAPTSTASRDRGMDLAIKTTPAVFYDIPDTNLTIGAWNEVKEYLGVNKGTSLKIWTNPYVQYRFNRALAVYLGYESEWHHDVDKTASLGNYKYDLKPGLVWNINRKVTLNPYLQFYNLRTFSLASAGVGAFFSAAVL